MISLGLVLLALAGMQEKPSAEAEKILREKAELLRKCPKFFAAFVKADAAKNEITLRKEGESEDRSWSVDPDAEIRVDGFWGRLEDLVPGDRIWLWARLDRDLKPAGLVLITDEISEQDVHQLPWTLVSADDAKREAVLRRGKDKKEETRTVKLDERVRYGESVFVQTAAGAVRRMLRPEDLEGARDKARARQAERWKREGLPGTVAFTHALAGELEVMLDHECMRWGRALNTGIQVKVDLVKPITAVVHAVAPFHERTRLTLAVTGREFSELRAGQRVRVLVPEPASDAPPLPTDAGRPRDKTARAEWVLASTYCNCSIAGDACTGMYYTLASCNPLTCGMPNKVRGLVAPMVDQGVGDKEILESLEKSLGPGIYKPHLLH
jgi:hypothetical protein